MNFVELFNLLEERQKTLPKGSGTTKLLKKGLEGILPKLNEECFEVGLALEHEGPEELALEVSQCFYYCLLLAVHLGHSYDSLKLDPSMAATKNDKHELAKYISRKAALLCNVPSVEKINELTPFLFNALNLGDVSLDQMYSNL